MKTNGLIWYQAASGVPDSFIHLRLETILSMQSQNDSLISLPYPRLGRKVGALFPENETHFQRLYRCPKEMDLAEVK